MRLWTFTTEEKRNSTSEFHQSMHVLIADIQVCSDIHWTLTIIHICTVFIIVAHRIVYSRPRIVAARAINSSGGRGRREKDVE